MTSWPSAGENAVRIERGVTAFFGSGGKTTLIDRLAQELTGTVIVCTSTHIYPAKNLPFFQEIREKITENCCVGTPTDHGKLTAPQQSFEELAALADYVLVEADGSKGLPLKAHLPHEPVIPACANQVIQVVGLSGLGKPIKEAVHRPERFAELCGCTVEDLATPERVAKVLNTEALADLYVLTQTGQGRELAGLLHAECKMLHAE